jgi:hypothetical protein
MKQSSRKLVSLQTGSAEHACAADRRRRWIFPLVSAIITAAIFFR